MISLRTFFRQKMAQFLIILFAGILLLSNIVIFTMSTIQYNRELDRQQQAFEEMLVHLLTMEGTDTAITYIEHYYHTQGIEVALYDAEYDLIYETSSNIDPTNQITLEDFDNQIIGTVYFDDQESVLGSDLTIGLLLLNGFSFLVFFVYLKFIYSYLNNMYGLVQKDFDQIGMDEDDFNFEDTFSISTRLREAIDTETRLKEYQKEYVRMLAHDIKTPLTVIKAYLEGVQLKRIDLDEDILKEMLFEVDEIERMIPKFITENIESTKSKHDVSKVVHSTLRRLNEVFQTRKIKVVPQIDDFSIEISYVDLSRIVEHLLFNAFYYNKEGGTITVTLCAKDRTFIVEDTGIGMDQETLQHLQEGGYRSEQAKRLNQKGSGLGMQIIYEIIHRNQFDIDIKSVLDQGTIVTVRF